MVRLPVVLPDRFHLFLADEIYEIQKISRVFGQYGNAFREIQNQRLLNCTEQRATLIGCGDLADGQTHVYTVPLPPSLSAQLVCRRLTGTLAWLTPVHPSHRAYRRAALWFSPPEEELLVRRRQIDWQMAQRGTVQHEILEGEQATAFVDGRSLALQVNCRALTGPLGEEIPYAVAVSLEVAEGVAIPVCEEIRARVRVGIPIEARNPNR
jgi:hypothetical protein